ncbi:hypothetical protein AB0C52_12890 [Streptomyces sp. NPDC048717]|uniref:hypothetical protein n=1 Tax=Streptomyces sp. NPDC048717 TaxID=3154928 RepID=UPI00344726F4
MTKTAAALVEGDQVHIGLQAAAAERLALSAGFPVFPAPMPTGTVRVRDAVPCPACGLGRLSRSWWMGSRTLVAGSGCRRNHVFIMRLPLMATHTGTDA